MVCPAMGFCQPRSVYVDALYPIGTNQVGFPAGNSNTSHRLGFDAFRTIQSALDQVQEDGVVFIASGTYQENLILSKPVALLGPNAGIAGIAPERRAEARLIPQRNDPENSPIVSVESDGIVLDGLMLDGSNPKLGAGYNANGVPVHAAAGVQNGCYPDVIDVESITVRNCVITNISYDGICLDRYPFFGTSSSWNYLENNKLVNMWEAILTYALDAVIANNVITNVTHGLSVHCVTTPAAKGFRPTVARNLLTIAQWWPQEIEVARAPGIWINFRRERASSIEVTDNIVNTPVAPPAFKTIVALYALTVDGYGKIRFSDNTVNGAGNCTIGLLATKCWSNDAVSLVRGSLHGIDGVGVLADTVDPKWGPGDSLVTISNAEISLAHNGVGVLALQEWAAISNAAKVEIIGETSITGGACGVQVRGVKSSASIVGRAQRICRNDAGIHVDGGRALIEGNILTNNRIAAIVVENGGIVDAGDCAGANVTGLGSGSGANGASAGLNDLSGYGFDRAAPWAITNSTSIPVLVDQNFFEATTSEDIKDAVSGPIQLSGLGTLAMVAPPPLEIECIGQLPVAAATADEFIAAGGSIKGEAVTHLSCRESIVTNWPGNYTIQRCYTAAGGCSQVASCNQLITARDDQSPTLHCSTTIVAPIDPGHDYATVTYTNLAADSCGELLGPWVPVSTGRFPIGTNTVIVIATDLAGNTSACSFDVAVFGPPIIIQQPLSRTNQSGTSASFKVTASSAVPMSFQWKKNGGQLTDNSKISGATSAELTVTAVSSTDAADYSVDVSNPAGMTSSASAHLTVITPNPVLRLLGFSEGVASLKCVGPSGSRYAIVTSTNLADWIALYTNKAPFSFLHTNRPIAPCRFYQAVPSF